MMDSVPRLLAGDQRTLSRAISSLERGGEEATQLMMAVDPHTGRANTIGITGPPGVGKSTIVDQLTELLRRQGLTIGIVAVDPTSPFTGGALLGDRIRMQRHYLDPDVFIRSLATRGQSGGLARTVKCTVRLLDAAGKDVVLVETVGVGQTELGIMGVADTVLVVLTPESGDAVQTLKAGIMEIADIYLVNKSDREGANQMATAITSMLRLAPSRSNWIPPVILTRADAGEGIDQIWGEVQRHQHYLASASQLEVRRQARRKQEFLETIEQELSSRLRGLVQSDSRLVALLDEVARKDAEPYSAAIGFLDSPDFQQTWFNPLLAKPD
jgi:LAO/AO transport system kinase